MAEVILFHHSLGLTHGIEQFADTLRNAHHVVHTPDLFAGRTFTSIEQGMAFIEKTGFEKLVDQGVEAAQQLSASVVYAGFSFGVMRRRNLRRPVAEPAALCCSILASLRSTSVRGRMECRSRFTVPTPIRTSSRRATSTLRVRLPRRPRMPNCFFIPAISIFLPTAHYRLTIRQPLIC